MKCPICGLDGAIATSRNVITSSGAAEAPARLFRVLGYQCRNKQCSHFEQDIGEERVELPVTTE